MACRYPGGVSSAEELWALVAEGRDAIGEFPSDRGWDLERIYNPDPDNPGTSYTRQGGFLAGAADFDPGFFEISPREAIAMDPQQRLLLEVAWEALEAGRIDPSSLRGSRTGVFAGHMFHEYGGEGGAPGDLGGYFATGLAGAVVSGRLSYTLGLEGPAITVDTACSSSLVTMHLAAQALRREECSLALAGGVAMLSAPDMFVESSRQGNLAPDGRCKSFAEGADGTGVAEGVGLLVLERLADAEANGHPVLATIRGSAVNQDGASNGLSAPNGPSQERVIREALDDAGLSAADVDAVEAHGTGTALGDPIEAGALLATYGQGREVPLRLGSIKSNIGHPQAAAGVAGVIKMVMAMREGALPRTLHVQAPSSKVDWQAGRVELLVEGAPWPAVERPRRAAVSSFAISGTNAHLILEEPQQPDAEASGGESPGAGQLLPGPIPLVLSAKSEPALHDAARRLVAHLERNPSLDVADVALSLVETRASFEHRAVVVGRDREQLLGALAALADADQHPAVVRGSARVGGRPVFVFPGHGSQWPQMALELLESSSFFAAQIESCESALEPFVEWSLREVLRDAGREWLEQIDVVQPTLFAVMVSLARLWQAFGVEPAAVVGHSQGEIAAACVAGGLSLEDAARLIAVRSKIIAKLTGQGALLSVALPQDEVESRLGPWQGRVELAAINGPSSAVLAGRTEAVEELLEQWQGEGVRVRRILGARAPSHCAAVEVLREEVLESFASLAPRSAAVPFHSTTAGEEIDTASLDAEYWYANMREPVRFEPVVRGLLEQGHRHFVEVGPHPVFALAVGQTIEQTPAAPADAKAQGTLRRDEGGPDRFALSLAEAHVHGVDVDWSAYLAGSGARHVALPTYPFQRKRHWLSPASSAADPAAIGQAAAGHPLLGASLSLAAGGQRLFTGLLSIANQPWLADHAAFGTALLAGTAFVELALRAGAEAGCGTLAELTILAPMILPQDRAVQVQVVLSEPSEDGSRPISIHSRPQGSGAQQEDEWALNAEGILAAGDSALPAALAGPWPPEGAEPLDIEDLYERLADQGVEYGRAFQGLSAAWKDGDAVYVEATLAEEEAAQAGRFGLHPALLDSAFHVNLKLGLEADDDGSESVALPFAWRGVSVHSRGATALRARLGLEGAALTDCTAVDAAGVAVASIEEVAVRPIEAGRLRSGQGRRSIHAVEWVSAPPPGPAPPQPRLALLGETSIEGLEGDPYADVPALVEAIDDGAVIDVAVLDCTIPSGEGDFLEALHADAQKALALLQQWSSEESLGSTRLALVTRRAVATGDGGGLDLGRAPLWGMARSAQSEHPGRFGLLDVDGGDGTAEALPVALGAFDREPQLAIRDGQVLVPRLARVRGEDDAPAAIDPQSTILITGGLSGVGAQVARHLATDHGARQLLLVSRRGEGSPAAAGLRAELEELGAEVIISACDVSQRAQLEALISAIPSEHPLGAVIHSAAALDDGVLAALDHERLERVLRPKADAAWHLHELTAGLGLSQFVMFSSAAGVLGGAGQANYSAANSFLDALAADRRSRGLPATSIAWGLWEQETDLASGLQGDEAMLRANQIRGRFGFAPMSPQRGLELFDAAGAGGGPLLVAGDLDGAALRAQARDGTLPAILDGLVRGGSRRGGRGETLSRQLAGMSEGERRPVALELVREHVAAVLGHESAAEVDSGLAFKEMGFDSLAAVELRNRLGSVTGLQLPPTVVFDYPSVSALADHLCAEVGEGAPAPSMPVRAATGSDEPIAIVGMACRYPGGVGSPRQLWELVASGADAISDFPLDRGWDLEGLYDPDPDVAGSCYARQGGFMPDAADFDPGFFGISPREALMVDPQQRLLLESCWEALEDAAVDPRSLKGSQAGVFAGVMYQDYASAESGVAPGMSTGTLSGRVSYTLGLEGPAISVDTACSSSLVAIHLAAQALRAGECSLALAGGSTVLFTPAMMVYFSRQRGLAPDGRCKPFAEAADGFGVSEGTGVLALERLSEAQRQGHQVLATIRGSAVNQDGASNGLTAPNGPSQERVIRQALANAGLEPADVDVVEAHGTGTALGDPIEAGALLATYGQGREQPLRLGSIKSNIGHAQAAAGVAGVIKMVMAMREGSLPKTLHLDAPSSKVDWQAGSIELLGEAQEWGPGERPRRAGVSSFGASGTNAHLVLEEGPQPAEERAERVPPAGPLPFVLSAKSEEALQGQASRLLAQLQRSPELEPLDVAYSLATSRARFERRAVAMASSREELLRGLAALAGGAESPDVVTGLAAREQGPAFLFGGQGSQHALMATELLDSSPAFADQMRACEAALGPYVDWSLEEALRDEEGRWLDRLDVVQPALFAVMVSLAALWRSSGVEPAVVVGHSQGEIAAAHIAGALSLEDAALVVARRAQAMAGIAGAGGMLAVSLAAEACAERLDRFEGRLSLAAINGPESLVVSGEPEALEALKLECERDGVRAQQIAVDYAAHSAQVEALRAGLLEAFAPISPREATIPFRSTVSGEPLAGSELDAEYWYRNLRQTVLLEPVIRSLLEQGQRTFVEIAPHPVLGFAVHETIDASAAPGGATVVASLRRDDGGLGAFTRALAAAHAAGAELDWQAFFADSGARAIELPTYPFQRRRYWPDAATDAGDPAAVGQAAAEHPFLGAVVEHPAGGGTTLTGRLSLATHPWLADHAVFGTVLFPGTGLLELALRAGIEAGAPVVEELALEQPLVVPEQAAVQLRATVGGPDEEGRREISIHSRSEAELGGEEAEWSRHAQGTLVAAAVEGERGEATAWPPAGAEPLELELLYERLAEHEVEYGPAFQRVQAAWQLGDEAFVEVALSEEQMSESGHFVLHPALLDSAAHVGADFSLRDDGAGPDRGSLPLPFAWRGVQVARPGASSLRLRMGLGLGGGALVGLDGSGAPVFQIDSVVLRPVERRDLQALAGGRRALHEVRWRPQPLPAVGGPQSGTLVADFRSSQGSGAMPEASISATAEALERLQSFLREEAAADTRLVFLTEGAVATREGEGPALATAAIWGLVRSALAEHPGRFGLLDSDGSEPSEAALAAALDASAEEPQLALREGELLVPRLARSAAAEGGGGRPLDPEETVLISGGTSGLGALLARHLVTEHGVRHLLLVSRSGAGAKGAAELEAELRELGAEARLAACDVADRGALEALLDSIPQAHPLGAVVHSAAVLDDGVLESLDPERLARVMGPKASGAWHLHELTEGLDLARFVLFSSVSGILGGAGQANYAAANSFLDALAAHRHAQGLAATSLAWGALDISSDLLGGVEAEWVADQVRRRLGLTPLASERTLELFDLATALEAPALAAVEFDAAILRERAKDGSLPAMQRDLVRVPLRREPEDSLARRLEGVPAEERLGVALDLVRSHAATVLGHASAKAIEPQRAFQELGFDSLAAVELRNRLGPATGLRLPPTLVFDYPSAAALAEHLLAEVTADGVEGEGEEGEAAFRAALARVPLSRLRDAGLLEELAEVVGTGGEVTRGEASGSIDEIDQLDADDLIERTMAQAEAGGEG
jgi:acyl transferase domain-containing protein/acyl carrier protein